MPNFTPRPDRSLVRRLQSTDEQLASVFNQSWQAIADNLQLIFNNLSTLQQQATAIAETVTLIENSFSSQQSQLASAQASASPALATSLQRNSEANSLISANNAATAKTGAANIALTAASDNLNSVATNAQPYNALLNAIAGMSRPANSMLGTGAGGATAWFAASGQSFTVEMAYFAMRTPPSNNGGAITAGSAQQIPIATAGFSNCRNQFGLTETGLDGNTLTLPCTGGNCRYYLFGWSTISGIGSANSILRADGVVIGTGTAVQSIAGRSAMAENFNQNSISFAPLNVGSSGARVILQGWVASGNPAIPTAALGINGAGGSSDGAGVLLLRRRIL